MLTYIAFYFVVWWLCLFMVLPFGVRAQHEQGEVTDGTEPGAPIKTHIWWKLLANSILSLVVMLLLLWGLSNPALQQYWAV